MDKREIVNCIEEVLGLKSLDVTEEYILDDAIDLFNVAIGIRKSARIEHLPEELLNELVIKLDIKHVNGVSTMGGDAVIYRGELPVKLDDDLECFMKTGLIFRHHGSLSFEELEDENIKKLVKSGLVNIHVNPFFKFPDEESPLMYSLSKSMIKRNILYCGQLLSFPECCISDDFGKRAKLIRTTDWVCWLPHVPCSENCSSSINLAEKIKTNLRTYFPIAYGYVMELREWFRYTKF